MPTEPDYVIDLSAICVQTTGVSTNAGCNEIRDIFAANRHMPAVAVLDAGDRPIGIAHRHDFMRHRPDNESCSNDNPHSITSIMESDPLVLDRTVDLATLTNEAVRRAQDPTTANFIVVDRGRLFGLATCAGLLRVLSDHLRNQMLEAEAAKREAENLTNGKSRFLANMTHELRTPLNGVIGFGQLIESESHGPLGAPEYKLYAKDIVDSGQHLIAIINDILDMAKLEAGRIDLHERFVDLRELAGRSLRMVATLAGQKQISLHSGGARNEWTVRADERRLQQAIVNLLSNAIKFTPTGGNVGVEFGMNAGWVWIDVWDEGCGIEEADLKRLFKPYEQVKSTLNSTLTGTGLGLTIARALMRAHGGEVELSSNVGQGTRATLKLPRSRMLAEEFSWSADGKVEFIDPPDAELL